MLKPGVNNESVSPQHFAVLTAVAESASSTNVLNVCREMSAALESSRDVYETLRDLRRFPLWMTAEKYEKRLPGQVPEPGAILPLVVHPGK